MRLLAEQLSLDSQCWANRLVAADGLFNIIPAFSETGAAELRRSAGSWRLRLTSSSDWLSSCVPVDLFQSPSCSPWVPHFLLFFFSFFFLSTSPPLLLRKRACPHFNSAKGDGLKMRSADSGAWLQMTVNYSVGDSGWRLAVPWPEEEENKERGGMEKVTSSAGTSSHHSGFSVSSCTHTHTSVSLWHPFLRHIACSLFRRCGRWKG